MPAVPGCVLLLVQLSRLAQQEVHFVVLAWSNAVAGGLPYEDTTPLYP
jgi:hypothetical protein